ncbi:cbb3-type cytochrome oxidase subunit 3 [Aliidiomarina haloalkalitolerans]|uniref:CcoQ/FixQ family Cbb3-type cytochrome c oxidase assembly chaperone n=1 Tax=Aliidiomarina haloalkalitolerans TaxID=859059 RepID=A0A432VYA0_9GAMM|nr:cbb3-type cytochrome c oxidase subunit 3 [Aliidiomarina haloalkalitolerans]RUO21671.1 CcoQ/FixQ family Cbb3-type cytochrome c oxidase assembly chaperone [Aliidiomarina haloalkalitolerans]
MGAEFQAVHTALVFLVIIIVIVWAFWPKNKDKFEHDANSIFEEDKKKNVKRSQQESDKDE